MSSKEKSVLDKIFQVYDKLFEAEKKIADYVINNQKKVVDMTVSELSNASNASEATIIRFCKKCDFKGFHHLKISLAKEMMRSSEERTTSNEISINKIAQSLENILANKIEELKQTISIMDEKNIKEILDVIKKARTVQFAAVGNTIPVALDGAYKFNQIGISSFANTIYETQLAFTCNISEGDVVIVISNSGSSKKLLTLVNMAIGRKAKVICITKHENSELAKLSDYVISVASREKLFLDEFNFTRVPFMAVIEILFLLTISNKEDAYECMNRHEQCMAEDKI